MDSHSKELTEYEVKWFEELARMRKEISGSKPTEELEVSCSTAQEQLEMLKPALNAAPREEKQEERPEEQPIFGFSADAGYWKRLGTE